ncbi:MAG TPA: FCD domain-containing protein [Burkholderiaceae bacterium]|nr:FCD domain-containing protein [Burkholderiaceae bacterium]HNB44188.1 FCD domain-containing protein [Burkholderiaceae bacterium]HNG80022.1 FCD domain-containing protein [Burkholderiaceae bacterium]
MSAADTRFPELLYALSGNALVAPALATHLTYTQRVMGEVLVGDETPTDIWDQHEAILGAICASKSVFRRRFWWRSGSGWLIRSDHQGRIDTGCANAAFLLVQPIQMPPLV